MGASLKKILLGALDSVWEEAACYTTVQTVKNYLLTDAPTGAVRLALDEPDPYLPPENITYCLDSSLPSIHDKENCVYWDKYEVRFPSTEQNAILVTTRIDTKYEAIPGCSREEFECFFEDASDEYGAYIADVEHFLVSIDHSFFSPETKISRQGRYLSGDLYNYKGEKVELEAPNSVGQREDYDYIEVDALLKAAGIDSLDNISTIPDSDDSWRDCGIVITLTISYSNKWSFNLNDIRYSITVEALPQTKYKTIETDYNENRTLRFKQERHGVRILTFQVGTLCKFDFTTLLLSFISGFGLLVFATAVVDFIATTIFFNHKAIELCKTHSTVLMTDKAKVPKFREKLEKLRLDAEATIANSFGGMNDYGSVASTNGSAMSEASDSVKDDVELQGTNANNNDNDNENGNRDNNNPDYYEGAGPGYSKDKEKDGDTANDNGNDNNNNDNGERYEGRGEMGDEQNRGECDGGADRGRDIESSKPEETAEPPDKSNNDNKGSDEKGDVAGDRAFWSTNRHWSRNKSRTADSFVELFLTFGKCGRSSSICEEQGRPRVGGKAHNLIRLSKAGLNVPRGFVVTTVAYCSFVDQNKPKWDGIMGERAPDTHPHPENEVSTATTSTSTHITRKEGDGVGTPKCDADSPESVLLAEKLRAAFLEGELPDGLRKEVCEAYRTLCSGGNPVPVAVRSSATTEDSSDCSFAGLHDTYLNVIGEDEVINSLVKCWSSLWNTRAAGYRARNHVLNEGASMAVIVQEMVQSHASGVAFTANPVSGNRFEIVIDSTFGLGEALVSGKVEPDHFVVDSRKWRIESSTTGSKRIVALSRKDGSGIAEEPNSFPEDKSLTDSQVLDLSRMCSFIQKEYGTPQDIEWAMTTDGYFHVLQSRAITSLYPVPELDSPTQSAPSKMWYSFGALQCIQKPLTPIGQDVMKYAFGATHGLFGGISLQERLQKDYFTVAGERIFVRLDVILKNPIGGKIIRNYLASTDPTTCRIISELEREEPILLRKQGPTAREVVRLLSTLLKFLPKVIYNFIFSASTRNRITAKGNTALSIARQYLTAVDSDAYKYIPRVRAYMREHLSNYLAWGLTQLVPFAAPSFISLSVLEKIALDKTLPYKITRSIPNNCTTEMDLELWSIAKAMRSSRDDTSLSLFQAETPERLTELFVHGDLPPPVQKGISVFLEHFGCRCQNEVDFGVKRWFEDPAPVMSTLKSFILIPESATPDITFAHGEDVARQAMEQEIAAQNTSGGWLRYYFGGKLVRRLSFNVRNFFGFREWPKMYLMKILRYMREGMNSVGEKLTATGILECPDDIKFLHMDDLERLTQNSSLVTEDIRELIKRRKDAYNHELMRRQVPRIILSDGRAFYNAASRTSVPSENMLLGTGVSPGIVTGRACVIHDPVQTQLQPGDILVCPGTDPAWTPLFLAAAGLVTEAGGFLSHGSVVAREYGIPAVVSVQGAASDTTFIRTGVTLRIDGTTGTVEKL
ncbi:phosphoenolpyruvate synthase [Pelomyxa schiedti]|nr:phosphoenolpyruvate synthase [Pelomyxa schiedti]